MVALELSLVAKPPHEVLKTHVAPDATELPVTKLIDPRMVETILQKISEIDTLREKKTKVEGERRKTLKDNPKKDKGNNKYLYSLFPYGPAKQACKIAGLPKPTGCI